MATLTRRDVLRSGVLGGALLVTHAGVRLRPATAADRHEPALLSASESKTGITVLRRDGDGTLALMALAADGSMRRTSSLADDADVLSLVGGTTDVVLGAAIVDSSTVVIDHSLAEVPAAELDKMLSEPAHPYRDGTEAVTVDTWRPVTMTADGTATRLPSIDAPGVALGGLTTGPLAAYVALHGFDDEADHHTTVSLVQTVAGRSHVAWSGKLDQEHQHVQLGGTAAHPALVLGGAGGPTTLVRATAGHAEVTALPDAGALAVCSDAARTFAIVADRDGLAVLQLVAGTWRRRRRVDVPLGDGVLPLVGSDVAGWIHVTDGRAIAHHEA